MSFITAAVSTVAGVAANKLLGGNETSTSVDRPAWLDSAMQGTIADLQNSPVAQVNPDNVHRWDEPLSDGGACSGWHLCSRGGC